MANNGSFPKPYVNSIPSEGADPLMVYVPFDKLDIGARSSGLPKGNLNGAGSLDHVGSSASAKKGGK